MAAKLDKYVLKNGMVVLGEQMAEVGSAAFSFMLPSGAATLPAGCCGAGSVIIDWIVRGTTERSSKELIDALDSLGLHRGNSVNTSHISLAAALEAGNLAQAIELYAEIILKADLKADQFELARQLAIQELLSLDDDPRQKVLIKLKEQFYPDPFGRPGIGTKEDLESLTPEKTADLIKSRFDISRTIFSVAGKYNFDELCKQLEKLFGQEQPAPTQDQTVQNRGDNYHEHHDGTQVHIGLMTETIPVSHEDYYNARAAVAVLSGGMSARLFTEVREKRGLCYAIGANYNTLKNNAGIACYAGTTPDKAQETLDVIIAEFDKLADGITEEEIQRAKVGLKSTLILQSESSSSRAGALGADYNLLGRVRTLEEIKQKIEELTVDSTMRFLKNNKFDKYTVVTIGPKTVKINR